MRPTIKYLWLLWASALLVGCSGHPFSPVGVYFGRYGGATECVEIKSDGTYRQVLVQGGTNIYDNAGSWTPNNSLDGLSFNNFYVAVDLSHAQQIRSPDLLPFSPEKYTVVEFSYGSASGEHWITAAPKTFYVLSTDKESPVLSAAQFSDEIRPLERNGNNAQQGVAGYPPQGVGSPER